MTDCHATGPQRGRNFLGLAVLCAGLMAFPLAANAANATSEISTAATHAGFAAKSASIKMVHAHMHHALNCLVGPQGNGFDAQALNPCKFNGNGAIPDTIDSTKRTELEKVARDLRNGLKDDTLSSAQHVAANAETALGKLK